MAFLTKGRCLERQARMRTALAAAGVGVAIVADRRNLMYFFGHFGREIHPAAALIDTDGASVLSRRAEDESPVFAERVVGYESARLGTLKPEVADLAFCPLLPLLAGQRRLGVDGPIPAWLLGNVELVDMRPAIAALQRRKDADEIALIGMAIGASETAYAAVEPLIVPGVPEIELFAAFQAAAVVAAGEAIGELGNDYRGGAMGGTPRREKLKAGELVPLDTGVMLRMYYSDLCRTYAVGGTWSDKQAAAARRVTEALRLAESMIRPGVSCKAVYAEVHAFLDGYNGWRFPHHLGHGFGLRPIETPRLNPHWDDVFEVGDTFTLEPGLYADELRGGVRLENDYALTAEGLRRLSDSTSYLASPLRPQALVQPSQRAASPDPVQAPGDAK